MAKFKTSEILAVVGTCLFIKEGVRKKPKKQESPSMGPVVKITHLPPIEKPYLYTKEQRIEVLRKKGWDFSE